MEIDELQAEVVYGILEQIKAAIEAGSPATARLLAQAAQCVMTEIEVTEGAVKKL